MVRCGVGMVHCVAEKVASRSCVFEEMAVVAGHDRVQSECVLKVLLGCENSACSLGRCREWCGH
jgi:hypothetical protein